MNKAMRALWIKTIIFSLILFIMEYLYIGVERGFSIYTINRAFATNAFVLIGLSLGLASFTYFTKKFQNKLLYRMYLGNMGFFMALIHGGISAFFYFFMSEALKPNFEFGKSWHIAGGLYIPNQVAFLLGIIALMIFAFMALISIRYFILKLGGVRWRLLLRYLGYGGFILVMFHFLIKNFDHWINPLAWHNLPPSNLILWTFWVIVVGLRLALWRSLSAKKKQVIA